MSNCQTISFLKVKLVTSTIEPFHGLVFRAIELFAIATNQRTPEANHVSQRLVGWSMPN